MTLTLCYLGIMVVIPLCVLFINFSTIPWSKISSAVFNARTLAAFKVTFGISILAALITGVLGLIISWTLTRYEFMGRRLLDSLVDIPFAMPTAVSGITLATIYSQFGWVGQYLHEVGIQIAFTRLGILLALVFIGLPFVVRSLEGAIKELEPEFEEVSACLGANRRKTFTYVVFPQLIPSLASGMTLALARGLGEYGSVIFIAGNLPYVSEIVPLLIVINLEAYDYAAAVAIAVTMLICSALLLIGANTLEHYLSRRYYR